MPHPPRRPAPAAAATLLAAALVNPAGPPLWAQANAPDPAGAGAAEKAGARGAEELFFSANLLYKRKLYPLARDEYEAFLRQHPGHPKAARARLGLALSTYLAGDYATAEPLLARAGREAAAGGERGEVELCRARCLLALKRPAEAEALFRAALGADGAGAKAREERARAGLVEALFHQRKWAGAVAEAGALAGAFPAGEHAPRARYQAALAHYELKQFREAAGLLGPLTAPANGQAEPPFGQASVFLLAECHRLLGDLEPAVKTYERAARKLDGDHTAEALFHLGYVQFERRRYDDAVRALEELRKKFDGHALAGRAHLLIGRCFLEKKDYDRAERELRARAAEAGSGGAPHLWLARAQARRGRHAEAAKILGEAVAQHPGDPLLPNLLLDRANALVAAGDHAAATAPLGRLLKDFQGGPRPRDAHRLQAFCLHKTGDYGGSRERCDAYLARAAPGPDGGGAAPEDQVAEVVFLRAENGFLLARRTEAEADYRRYLEGAPKPRPRSSVARARLGLLRYQAEDWAGARGHLEPLTKDLGKLDETLRPSVAYALADANYRLERWADARRGFDEFARRFRQAAGRDGALFKTAAIDVREGEVDRAAGLLEQLEREHPASPILVDALVELGRLRYTQKRHPPARRALEEAVRQAGDGRGRPAADYYLGWVARAEGQNAEAEQHFARVTAVDGHPLAVDARLQLGLIRFGRDDFAGAVEPLAAFVEKSPEDPRGDQALTYLGIARARLGQHREAAQSFRRAAEGFPASPLLPRARYEWAWCERAGGERVEAKRLYKEVATGGTDPALAQAARFEWAELEFEDGAHDRAAALLREVIEEAGDGGARPDPSLASKAGYRLGWCHYRSERWKEAAEAFEKALETAAAAAAPERPAFLPTAAFQAGEARLRLKQTAAAAALFQRALEAGGATSVEADVAVAEQALLRLGECHALAARWPEAEQANRRFLAEHPGSTLLARAQLGLGWALENQGEFEEAIGAYALVLAPGRRDETSARAQFQTGECLFALKRYDEAVRALARVEVSYAFPLWSSRALLEAGRALEAQGKVEAAAERFREVIEKHPATDAATVAQQRLAEIGG